MLIKLINVQILKPYAAPIQRRKISPISKILHFYYVTDIFAFLAFRVINAKQVSGLKETNASSFVISEENESNDCALLVPKSAILNVGC